MGLFDLSLGGFSPLGLGAYDLFLPSPAELLPSPYLSSYHPIGGFGFPAYDLLRAPLGNSLFSPRYEAMAAVARVAPAVGRMGAEDWRYDPMNWIGLGGLSLFGIGLPGVDFAKWPLFNNPWPFWPNVA